MEYKQVGIPKVFYERFLKFQPVLGFRTFSEFIVDAVRKEISLAEIRADGILDQKVEERMNKTVVI